MLYKPNNKATEGRENKEKYMSQLTKNEIRRYNILEKKNKLLFKELTKIIENTKSILEKEKEKKEIQKIKRKKMREENEDILNLKKELKDQKKKIDHIKKEIQEKKYIMEKAYQYQLIREKEDELYHLEQEAQKLKQEKYN